MDKNRFAMIRHKTTGKLWCDSVWIDWDGDFEADEVPNMYNRHSTMIAMYDSSKWGASKSKFGWTSVHYCRAIKKIVEDE